MAPEGEARRLVRWAHDADSGELRPVDLDASLADITGRAAADPDGLSEQQRDLLRGLVRSQIRRVERGRASLRAKFGDEYDGAAMEGRLAFLEELYRTLGGDPDRISNREGEP